MTEKISPFQGVIDIGVGRLNEAIDTMRSEYVTGYMPVGHVRVPPGQRASYYASLPMAEKWKLDQQMTPEQRAQLGGV